MDLHLREQFRQRADVEFFRDGPQHLLCDNRRPLLISGRFQPVRVESLTDSLQQHGVPDYEGALSSVLSRQGNVESAKQTTDLLEIVEDGQVRPDEYQDFVEIKGVLDKIALSVANLQLWVNEQIAEGNLKKPDQA